MTTQAKQKSTAPKVNRRLHRVGALLSALPVLVVIVSGVFLQVKKEWSWVQPPTQRGSTQQLSIDWDTILASAAGVPEAGIETWDDVDRLDVRPGKGMLKVRAKSRWEVQLDATTGEVLQTSYRRSDLIESIHDGSFFGRAAKLWVFLPAAFVLLGLWLTGIYLWLLPHLVRRRRRA
ncbi:MAG: PepSY-associated TM helix domain-containing protein [Planctomycetota bacterium]